MIKLCLGMLHVMWGAWCVDYLWLCCDGYTHEVACLLERMNFFGGGALGILEKGVDP